MFENMRVCILSYHIEPKKPIQYMQNEKK
jgi:hypothetical protein